MSAEVPPPIEAPPSDGGSPEPPPSAPPLSELVARAAAPPPEDPIGPPALSDALEEIKFRVHRRLIQELETSRLDKLAPEAAQPGVEAAARQILQQEAPGHLRRRPRRADQRASSTRCSGSARSSR